MRKVVLVAVILVAIVVAIAAGLLILYGFYRYSELESCDRVLDKMATFDTFGVPNSWNISYYTLTSLCNNVTEGEDGRRGEKNYLVESQSCDLYKIEKNLNNPENLNLDELRDFILISDILGVYRFNTYMKEMVGNELREECNLITAFSSSFYKTPSEVEIMILFTRIERYMSKVMANENITKNEKKECIIDMLNAEKKLVEFYSNSYSEVDYDECPDNVKKWIEVLDRGEDGLDKIIGKKNRERICNEMIKYRKNIFEKVKVDKIDYNQKYEILFVLYLQKGGIFIPVEEFNKGDKTFSNERKLEMKRFADTMENEKCRAILEDV